MYRYGDGTPFPLDENFIETLTTAVETCTNAFVPLTELDARRTRAKDTKREADLESARLNELEGTVVASLASYVTPDKKASVTQAVAQKLATAAKTTIAEAKRQIDARVLAVETQALAKTSSEAVMKALGPFFDQHQLPKAAWIMSWDVRGSEPHADAVATAGPISASFQLSPDPYRTPIRVEQLAERVVVHMMKKGVFGKAKPAPVDLGKYVMVAFERTVHNVLVVTLKENPNKSSSGLRFSVGEKGATWVTISAAGDSEGEDNELDMEDVAPVRSLAERAAAALKDLIQRRTLVELTFNGKALADVSEPNRVPMELLAQLTPLARSIRDKSRMSGELVLKRDIGDGRREELFVPRSTLAQQFTRLPYEYRKPFEEMGITAEETSPSIQLPLRPPATTKSDVDLDDNE
jgi:ribosomal protein L17